ncbi:ABC-F family ATP-binding cassette domain-containing protein [Brachybacterium hainanense]|uniref:ABC-F family ATP-binding cassette domain-containing protein n=1 Tax=Brachybacterium hainanense TaxID=1541174 RepID=A0ABV6R934_9MICO
MAHLTQSAVTLTGLSFSWPDGSPALTDLSATIGTGRTGLIGANGTGKTTLLRLIRGDLRPTSGSVSVTGSVGHLPQQLTLRTGASVAELLGVHERLAALRAIEAGDADPARYTELAEDWDVEARGLAALDRIGLPGIGLDRPVGALSGGETVLAALAGLQLARNDVVLLDEPTNNLDRRARCLLHEAVAAWRGTLLVVSHDVALLKAMDATAELHAGELTVFGGPFDAYQDHLATEQAAAEQALRAAQQQLRTEQRQRIEAQTKLARRQRYARTDFENKRKPKIIMNNRKQEAQVSAGKLRGRHDASVDAAKEAVTASEARIRRTATISIDLPDPAVPAGRRLAALHDARGTEMVVQGPVRIALTGPNGIGKTRLVQSLLQAQSPVDLRAWARPFTERIGILPQRLDHLAEDATVLQTVREAAPSLPDGELRSRLARFLFRGQSIERRIGDLSGGERFRVAIARLLLADPPHQLIVLDEPTNSLDLDSVDELVDALSGYRGGMIVISHDDAFLDRLEITDRIALDDGGLRHGTA